MPINNTIPALPPSKYQNSRRRQYDDQKRVGELRHAEAVPPNLIRSNRLKVSFQLLLITAHHTAYSNHHHHCYHSQLMHPTWFSNPASSVQFLGVMRYIAHTVPTLRPLLVDQQMTNVWNMECSWKTETQCVGCYGLHFERFQEVGKFGSNTTARFASLLESKQLVVRWRLLLFYKNMNQV